MCSMCSSPSSMRVAPDGWDQIFYQLPKLSSTSLSSIFLCQRLDYIHWDTATRFFLSRRSEFQAAAIGINCRGFSRNKNYQTRSQICGSKLSQIKFGDCHLGLSKSVVPRWSNFFWGDFQARRCHRGAAWKIHHEGSSRWRNFVIYFMAYSFHEGLTLSMKTSN